MGTLRNYISQADLQSLIDITITNSAEANEQISIAEEMVDNWVGPQDKHIKSEFRGTLTAVNGVVVQDTSPDSQLSQPDNYFINCVIEIVGGTGAGQTRRISESTSNILTVDSAWTTTPDSTSVYRVHQLAKFPRIKDVMLEPETQTYYKPIPEKVKLAVAAQVAYMINMGDDYFAGADADATSENIGNYGYSNGGIGSGGSQTARVRQMSPKARSILNGITNRRGQFVD